MASTTATATPTRRSARTSTSTNGTNPRTRKSPTGTTRRTTTARQTASKVKTPGPETEPKSQAQTTPPAEPAKTETPKTTHQFLLMSGGKSDFLVHETGCKRVAPDLKKSQYDAPYGFSPASREDAVRELWDDQIRESWDGPEGETPDLDWLRAHGYVDSVGFHSCVKLDALPKPPKVDTAGQKRAAKTELATRVVEAVAAMVRELPADNPIVVALGGKDATAKTAAHWVHHVPADRNRWVAAGLPKPDRSDWR